MPHPNTSTDPSPESLARLALGFDLETELELCRHLASTGGSASVRAVFRPARAARLFQSLLSTGRHLELDGHWREAIAAGVERGTLAPPEWN
jgi:hypothetical protein